MPERTRCEITGCREPLHSDVRCGMVNGPTRYYTLCRQHAKELFDSYKPLLATAQAHWTQLGPNEFLAERV